jgi:hypothetical protein
MRQLDPLPRCPLPTNPLDILQVLEPDQQVLGLVKLLGGRRVGGKRRGEEGEGFLHRFCAVGVG